MTSPDLDTSLSYCTFCPKLCRHACPVSNAEPRETLVPQAKMQAMNLVRRGTIDNTVENTAALYGCTGCLACTEACHLDVAPGRHLFTGRAEAQHAGTGHPALQDLPERVRGAAEKAARAARESAPGRSRAEAQLAFFPGCEAPETTASAMRLFDRIGAEYIAVAEVSLGCGGYPLHAGGFREEARMHAESLARELSGYARVVVGCPACAWLMKSEYPRWGVTLRPEIVHTVELLAEFAERLPIADAAPSQTAYYHDPCYLGRWRGIYDAPRKLLHKARVDVREFSRSRAEAECSGGGGVLPLTMPDVAARIADNRLVEVRESGVATVVTACPTCKRQLARAGVVVRDIVDVLEEATR